MRSEKGGQLSGRAWVGMRVSAVFCGSCGSAVLTSSWVNFRPRLQEVRAIDKTRNQFCRSYLRLGPPAASGVMDMDESLIEALSQREHQIIERQRHLEQFIKEYKDLTEEQQLIASLLQKYRAPLENTPLSSSPNISPSLSPPSQDSILMPHADHAKPASGIRTRQSPGETAKYVDDILGRGESHSIVSLIRRIREVRGISLSDSTIGLVLRRGLEEGKYGRDGSIWRMASN